MKKRQTFRGGNIQICVKPGIGCESDPVGIMACDEDAFKTFSDIFGPIISDLHPKFDFRYSYKSEPITLDALQRDIDALKHQSL